MMPPCGEIVRFGCVGVAAMLVHLAVVSVLVPLGMPPLAANVPGFFIAFQVSFFGHRHWTFGAKAGTGQYPRMLAVSICAFLVNEALYSILLGTGAMNYQAALFTVLLIVAAGTYAASRLWVFRRP